MKLNLPCLATASLAVAILCSPVAASAKSKKKTADASPSPSEMASPSPSAAAVASPTAKSDRPIPYRGTISAVDMSAKTFTIAGKEKSRVFKITNDSKLTKGGVPATVSDVVVNEEVRGSYWKKEDGSLEAKSVKLGPLTAKEEAAKEAHKAKRAEGKKAAATPTPAS